MAEHKSILPEARAPTPTLRRNARIWFALAVTALGLWIISPYLSSLAWAALIVITSWPLYARFTRRRSARTKQIFAPALFTIVAALLVFVPLTLVAVEVAREAQKALGWIGQARKNGVPPPRQLAEIPGVGPAATRWWENNLSNPKSADQFFSGVAKGSLASLSRSTGGSVFQGLMGALLMFISLFIFYRDGEQLASRVRVFADRWLGRSGQELSADIARAVRGVVNGTVLVAIGEGGLLTAAYAIAGVPYPFFFGALTVAAALLPVIGAWIAYGAASLVLLQQGSVGAAIGLFAFGAVVVLVGDNFVQPKLIGGAAHLPYLATFIGMLGGIQTFGLIGLFLGPVIMVVLLCIWNDAVDTDAAAK